MQLQNKLNSVAYMTTKGGSRQRPSVIGQTKGALTELIESNIKGTSTALVSTSTKGAASVGINSNETHSNHGNNAAMSEIKKA